MPGTDTRRRNGFKNTLLSFWQCFPLEAHCLMLVAVPVS